MTSWAGISGTTWSVLVVVNFLRSTTQYGIFIIMHLMICKVALLPGKSYSYEVFYTEHSKPLQITAKVEADKNVIIDNVFFSGTNIS